MKISKDLIDIIYIVAQSGLTNAEWNTLHELMDRTDKNYLTTTNVKTEKFKLFSDLKNIVNKELEE